MKRVALLLLAFALALGFVRLGLWQLHRAAYKQMLIANSQRVLASRRALPLAGALDRDADDGEYVWVAGDGHFLPLPAVLLDDQIREGRPGLRVYRVFRPDGGAQAVLVELGWRPLASHREIPAEPPPPMGAMRLSGLLSPPPAAGLMPGGSAVQRQPDGALLLLRLDPAIRLGYARDLQVLSGPMTPERHRGYAVQWFALAFGLTIASLIVFFRKPQ